MFTYYQSLFFIFPNYILVFSIHDRQLITTKKSSHKIRNSIYHIINSFTNGRSNIIKYTIRNLTHRAEPVDTFQP